VVTEPGGPEVFEIQELDDPQPGPEQVLVAVRATALNRVDLLHRAARHLWSPFERC
jgi:NADPH:quinone reductase-like Zn-dependent oxidoreductase